MLVFVHTFLLFFFYCSSKVAIPQEHLIPTGCGSVSVIVYGDQDKPALITYPDLALNRECECLISLALISSLICLCDFNLFLIFSGNLTKIFVSNCSILQICHVFRDYFFVQKQLLCCSTISAYTISALLAMRSVICFEYTYLTWLSYYKGVSIEWTCCMPEYW